MTEHIAEEQLALYATCDLAPDDTSAVTAHVENCGAARMHLPNCALCKVLSHRLWRTRKQPICW